MTKDIQILDILIKKTLIMPEIELSSPSNNCHISSKPNRIIFY
jgi:hypothetical protein